MKDAHLAKQKYTHAGAFPRADLRPEGHKQRLNVGPADRAADRTSEDQVQRGFLALFHNGLSTIF